MAVAAGGVDSNKSVSDGLSVLEGKSIRVRRESPSKGLKNGSQMVPVPFALVGAIGEACGEASGVSVSGTPPCKGVVSPPDIENRYRFAGIKKAPRVGRCAWWRLVFGGGYCCGQDVRGGFVDCMGNLPQSVD